jgi:hypothetical protein
MARFAQYAMVASEEALKDAEWAPTKEEDLEASVWNPVICLFFLRADILSGCLYGLWYW